MKVLVCDPISPKGIALLQQRPEFEVVVLPKRLSEAELLPVVKDVVAMVVRSETKVTAKVIEAAPQLGVLGLGRIGTEVAKRAVAFGMKVVGYDPFLTEARARALGIELTGELDQVYRDADFITVHMPVTEQTRGMLNAGAFAKMKPKV